MAEVRIYSGVLKTEHNIPFIEDEKGKRLFEGYPIWSGYARHFIDREVHARFLPQCDYESGKPILIIWPKEAQSGEPFFELYYNERLVKYPASTFGHIALNINGAVYNFSHLINENEAMRPEEYLYRPALGEFAPHPVTGRFDVSDPQKPYYDKFGRNFMRTIHVARVVGADVERLRAHCDAELRRIYASPRDPERPHKYSEFNFFTRSCTTIIRDALRAIGFYDVKGIIPRDMFISAAAAFYRARKKGRIRCSFYLKPQLVVPEALLSRRSWVLNPRNWLRIQAHGRLFGYGRRF